mgnify:CR=1 FL=1
MDKSNTNARYISRDENLILENITILNIANYSDVKVFITLDDVTEAIPPFDVTSGFAAIFEIKGDGMASDVEIKLAFDRSGKSVKSGNAVLRYKKLIINQDKC